ncbi:MAG: hypothetical protein ABIH17_09510 [Pseudomonadota bacterium]
MLSGGPLNKIVLTEYRIRQRLAEQFASGARPVLHSPAELRVAFPRVRARVSSGDRARTTRGGLTGLARMLSSLREEHGPEQTRKLARPAPKSGIAHLLAGLASQMIQPGGLSH